MFCFRERLVDQQINVSALHVIFRYTCSMIYMNINVHNLLTVLYISYGIGKENLDENQELFKFGIICLILTSLMF